MQVTTAASGRKALECVETGRYDAICSDYDLPDMDGITLHRQLQQQSILTPFIFYSSPSREEFSLPAGERVLSDFSQKIREAVELYRTRNRLELYSRHLEELVEERTRQLKEAQRFAVLGELSTMIGHDMRNPLQVITNLNYLLKRKVAMMTQDEAEILNRYGIPELFSRLNAETQYLNKIVSDLQDYAREVSPKRERIIFEPFIREIIGSVPGSDDVQVSFRIPPDLEGSGDPFLLKRVLVNLITNAFQAMESGGLLTIEGEETGEGIKLRVRDTGTGIPAEIQGRIFEPLFTTKSKGTGLGLPVSKRLVEVMGGSLSLIRSDSDGTIIEITIPYTMKRTG